MSNPPTKYSQIKSFIIITVFRDACNEFAGPTSASLRPGNTAFFEKMLRRWRAVGNFVSNLTDPRFEPLTSRSRDERATTRPTE